MVEHVETVDAGARGSSNANDDRIASQAQKAAPVTIEDGTGRVFDMRGWWKLTLLAGSGATVTAFRVDNSRTYTAPSATERAYSDMPEAEAAASIENDWPFVLVRASGGSVTVCQVG